MRTKACDVPFGEVIGIPQTPPTLEDLTCMGLFCPGNIPIAVRSLAVLQGQGRAGEIPGYNIKTAVVLFTTDTTDEVTVWASPHLRGYRSVWRAAARMNAVDPLAAWGNGIDVDHLYPKSWAKVAGMEMAYVRLFPVWQEVNRSAGAGREKAFLAEIKAKPIRSADLVYADELQVLKIIGHPVGTATKPESIFSKRRKR
jgi:hypothetical protein